jgi:cytochrome c1
MSEQTAPAAAAAATQPHEYVCAACGGTFRTTWTDEEAVADSVKVFGVQPTPESSAVICDDCYQQMMRRANG